MFKNWIKDDPDKMSLIAETDFKYWKITEKMIKDEEDLLGVQELFKNNISKLKDIFANLASNSDWPCITQLDFGTYAEKAKIRDKKAVNMACVDRQFIATNFKEKGSATIDGNPANALTRFEFLEILARLGKEKYIPH